MMLRGGTGEGTIMVVAGVAEAGAAETEAGVARVEVRVIVIVGIRFALALDVFAIFGREAEKADASDAHVASGVSLAQVYAVALSRSGRRVRKCIASNDGMAEGLGAE